MGFSLGFKGVDISQQWGISGCACEVLAVQWMCRRQGGEEFRVKKQCCNWAVVQIPNPVTLPGRGPWGLRTIAETDLEFILPQIGRARRNLNGSLGPEIKYSGS